MKTVYINLKAPSLIARVWNLRGIIVKSMLITFKFIWYLDSLRPTTGAEVRKQEQEEH